MSAPLRPSARHRRPKEYALVAAVFGVSALFGCGGKLTATPECECTDRASCPSDDACGTYTCASCACLLMPEPENRSCPEGYCDGDGACVTRAQICAHACEFIPPCMTSTPTDCYEFCFNDLGDCSATELHQTNECTDVTLTPVCHADDWLVCVTAIPCLEGRP